MKSMFRNQALSLLVVMFLLFTANSYSQFSVGKLELNKVIPPSPEAAALGQYGQIPVSLSTGAINIQVPFYTVTSGKLGLSVGLSYNGTGVKVEEIASTIGLGWVLNAGGMITRTIVGLPDDQNGDGTTGGYLINTNSNVEKDASAITTSQTDADFLRDVATSKIIDTEPDIFFYNFGSNSGKFVFDRQKKAVTIPYSNLKIVPSIASGIQSFKATDENGVIYEFNEVAYTNSFYKQYAENSTGFTMLTQTEIFSGPSSWYLTRIISPDFSDTIKIVYESTYTYLKTSVKDFYAQEGYKNNTSGIGPDVVEDMTYGLYPHSEQSNTSGVKLVKQIFFKTGKIEFEYAYDRQDITSTGSNDGYTGRLTNVSLYNVDYTGGYSFQKKITLSQTYFESDGTTKTQKHYRLKLNEVIEKDKNNIVVGSHKMEYDEVNKLPPRDSYAQDFWGYYNGQTSNAGMLQTRTVYSVIHPTSTYNIGNANRSPSATYMTSGVLKKLYYPTGGYSEFSFEPNVYESFGTSVQTATESIQVVTGTTGSTASLSFLNQSKLHTGSVTFSISKYSDKIADISPYAYIKDANTGYGNFVYFHSPDSTKGYITSVPYIFDENHTYQIYIYTHAGSPAGVTVSVTAAHNISTSAPEAKMMGGLRIAKVKHFDNTLAVLEDVYKYGVNENGMGRPIIDQKALTVFSRQLNFKIFKINNPAYPPTDPGNCIFELKTGAQHYTNPVIPLSDLNGSLIGYEQVTKYSVNPGNESNSNGKEIFYFNILQDYASEIISEPGYYAVDSKPWKNGTELGSSIFNFSGSGSTANSVEYSVIKDATPSILKVAEKFITLGTCSASLVTKADYVFFNYPLSMGVILPVKETKTVWGPGTTNTTLYEFKEYQYGNLTHLLPTVITQKSSTGELISTVLKRPSDIIIDGADNTGVYNKMLLKNMVAPVVKTIVSRNGVQLAKTETNYRDWLNDSRLIVPETISQQIKSNPTETKVQFNQYNANGSLLEQQVTNDIKQSYIWGYNNNYPIAEVKNAAVKDVFHTSFEDADGNSTAGDSKTGRLSRLNSYTKALTGLTNGNYLLTYWKKVSGVWALQSSTVAVSSTTYTISLTGQVDEVRFYPANAQMTTYTFDPLIGITGQCDANNRLVYYQYDAFNRLSLVIDQNNNILKRYCYNYAGQTENCTYTLPMWQNTATAIRCKKDGNNQNMGDQEQEQKDMNPSSPTYNQLRWIVIGTNLTSCPIPPPCTGPDKMIINGVCVTGTKRYTASVWVPSEGKWSCKYKYTWQPDCVSSIDYYELKTSACTSAPACIPD